MKITEITTSEDYIQGKPANKSKNYIRKGGGGIQFKWRVELNNGKVKLVWADTKANAKDQLGTNELIIGVKSAKKIEADENN